MTDNETQNEIVDVEAIETAPADQSDGGNAPKAPKGGNFFGNLAARMDSFWGISAKGSSFKTELIGGLTTFFAMCYIMVVNPNQMSGTTGTRLWNAIFIATALGTIVGTLLMSLFAKLPFAQAPGMGLNSFFFVSFMLAGFGTAKPFTEEAYAAGLSVILLSGIVFMILSFTGLRAKIAKAMPECLKKAIPAGIGLFIALIAFKNAGLVQFNPYTFVQLGNVAIGSSNPIIDLSTGSPVVAYQTITWYSVAPILVAFIGFMIVAALNKTKLKKGAIIIGIIASTGLFYLFNIGNASAYTVFENMVNPGDAFVDFGELSFGQAFIGFKYWEAETVLSGILLVITFCLVDMFDTFGTLQGTATEAGMLDEEGNPQRMKQALMSDSTATLIGAVVGTSTVTTYVESSAGVSAGARTGFSSLIVALLFFVAMFLSPLASIIPSSAVAPALMYVGVLMLKNIKDVDFKDVTSAVPAFLALVMMPLTYSISNGIAMGMISYTILKLVSIRSLDDVKSFLKKDSIVAIIAILFVVRYFLVYM